ncbi:hypothetical protein [Shewanella holmiensis]|uniref:Uncharacterized protein n=1 Tax=Shewanella holmiensis TaxID=2952222 RepID=A0A9X3AXM2_9GAMM|nr:hypothetical protein [Shewanella holmiensis]MCT7943308.1 hypothetical protein [Shewanella holmiensis]
MRESQCHNPNSLAHVYNIGLNAINQLQWNELTVVVCHNEVSLVKNGGCVQHSAYKLPAAFLNIPNLQPATCNLQPATCNLLYNQHKDGNKIFP